MKRGIPLTAKKSSASKSVLDSIAVILKTEVSLGNKGLNTRQKTELFRDLYVLSASGIDLISSLDLAMEGTHHQRVNSTVKQIKRLVIEGSSVADAFLATSNFSTFEIAGLRVGEETGRLNEVFIEFVRFFSKKNETRRRIISLTTYPVVIMLTAFSAVAFMLGFVVPMFQDVFSKFGKELPALTKFIIAVSNVFINYAGMFILSLGVFIAFIFINRRQIWFRRSASNALLRIPFIGELVSKTYLARFCMAMELLLSSRTPLLKAIELAGDMIGFYPIKNALPQVAEDIMQGLQLHLALEKHRIFEKRMTALLKVGEEVNKLDEMFGRLKEQYLTETEFKMGLLSNLLEPLIIIIIGFLVGFILVGMYLPVFQMGTTIG